MSQHARDESPWTVDDAAAVAGSSVDAAGLEFESHETGSEREFVVDEEGTEGGGGGEDTDTDTSDASGGESATEVSGHFQVQADDDGEFPEKGRVQELSGEE